MELQSLSQNPQESSMADDSFNDEALPAGYYYSDCTATGLTFASNFADPMLSFYLQSGSLSERITLLESRMEQLLHISKQVLTSATEQELTTKAIIGAVGKVARASASLSTAVPRLNASGVLGQTLGGLPARKAGGCIAGVCITQTTAHVDKGLVVPAHYRTGEPVFGPALWADSEADSKKEFITSDAALCSTLPAAPPVQNLNLTEGKAAGRGKNTEMRMGIRCKFYNGNQGTCINGDACSYAHHNVNRSKKRRNERQRQAERQEHERRQQAKPALTGLSAGSFIGMESMNA
jgi:hypothetical protein